jgi:hypothetical protein
MHGEKKVMRCRCRGFNKRGTNVLNRQTWTITYSNSGWTIKWLRIGEVGRIGCSMCVCARVSQPLVVAKVFIFVGCHGCQLLGWMATLVGTVHVMVAIEGAITAFATNLVGRILMRRRGSTRERVPDSGNLRLL